MAGLLSPVRRRFGQALRNSTALRELRAQTDKKLRRQADRFDGLLKKQAKEISSLKASLTAFGEQLAELKHQDDIRHLDYGRLTPQVGAVEQRVGRLEQWLADGVRIADHEMTAEARDALEELRREHEKIRVRMQTVSWYEERLRRVEASVAAVYEGDRRHPI
jgi:DNA repair exonuclease SbcCD ATPase subunit